MRTKTHLFGNKPFFRSAVHKRTFTNKDAVTMGQATRIFHLTDTEGDAHSFINAINKSNIVSCDAQFQLSFKDNEAIPYFVFGGDAQDRGPNDLKILGALVEFKEKHPDNVILLAGNRDITKNRMKIELDPALIRSRLMQSAPPRWLPADKPTVPRDYVINLMQEKGINHQTENSINHFINSLSVERCQLIYLHWMLEKSMGCPKTFRYRREELSHRFDKEYITDEDVLRNFIFETSPDGVSGKYLQLAQIAAIIPNTDVLVIHGGLTPTSIGRIPENTHYFEDVHVWINAFNQWYDKQIENWVHFDSSSLTIPACTALDQSVLPIPGQDKFIITEDNLGKNREFIEINPQVVSYLERNRIQVVLSGHQPGGDHPVIIRDNNLLFINGDTGYAKFNPGNQDDTRGPTCHTLELVANSEETICSINATLADNTQVTTQLTVNSSGISGDPYIGKILPGAGLIQCKLEEGYRIANQKGFNVTYSTVSIEEIEEKINLGKLSVSRM